MAIPVSEDVRIIPGILSGTGESLVFSGLMLTCSTALPPGQLLKINSAAEAAAYFGQDSAHFRAARVYFNGFDGSLMKPTVLFFYRHTPQAVPAAVTGRRGGSPAAMLSALRLLKDGTLSMMLGRELTLTGLDFSAASSLSQAAAVLEDAIRNAGDDKGEAAWRQARVTFSSLSNAFTVTAGTAGAQTLVSLPSGSAAAAMNLTEDAGGSCHQGAEGCSFYETMEQVLTRTGNFITFTTVEETVREEEALSLASWAADRCAAGDQFLYFFHTADVTLGGAGAASAAAASCAGTARAGTARTVSAGSGREIAARLLEAGYEGTAGVYGGIEYAAFFMGTAASIDYTQPGSTITFKFRSQSGLAANVTDLAAARELDGLKLNYIGSYASRNDSFTWAAQGQMFSQYGFLDTWLNSAWLCNALQVQLVAGLRGSSRVPYSREGCAAVSAWCQSVISMGRSNGVIETGISIDEAQRNALQLEAGADISEDLVSNGYFLKIDEAPPSVRQSRSSPACHLWYAYAGAVHRLSLPVTTVA